MPIYRRINLKCRRAHYKNYVFLYKYNRKYQNLHFLIREQLFDFLIKYLCFTIIISIIQNCRKWGRGIEKGGESSAVIWNCKK